MRAGALLGCLTLLCGCWQPFSASDFDFSCSADAECQYGARCLAGVCDAADAGLLTGGDTPVRWFFTTDGGVLLTCQQAGVARVSLLVIGSAESVPCEVGADGGALLVRLPGRVSSLVAEFGATTAQGVLVSRRRVPLERGRVTTFSF